MPRWSSSPRFSRFLAWVFVLHASMHGSSISLSPAAQPAEVLVNDAQEGVGQRAHPPTALLPTCSNAHGKEGSKEAAGFEGCADFFPPGIFGGGRHGRGGGISPGEPRVSTCINLCCKAYDLPPAELLRLPPSADLSAGKPRCSGGYLAGLSRGSELMSSQLAVVFLHLDIPCCFSIHSCRLGAAVGQACCCTHNHTVFISSMQAGSCSRASLRCWQACWSCCAPAPATASS